ncbi:hypothetical protein [Chitinophaga sp. 22620]
MAREIFSIAGSFTSFHHPKPYTMEKLQDFMLLFRGGTVEVRNNLPM